MQTPAFIYTPRLRPNGYEFVAGQLSLDFANTVDGLRGDRIQENLPSYKALVRWSQQAGALPDALADQLLAAAAAQPDQATAIHARAVALREAIFNIFANREQDEAPAEADLNTLNRELGRAQAHMRLTVTPAGIQWQWEQTPDLEWPLWPIAQAAGELLASDQRRLVHECAGDDCGWLFLDTTKNHSRRWCDMKGCGNRAKVQRYRKENKPVQKN